MRYSSTWVALATPGPTNQKSVPGAEHCPVASPSEPTCSTSRPWAMAPVAWTTTPPRPGVVATAGPGTGLLDGEGEGECEEVPVLAAAGDAAAGRAAAADTGDKVSTPGVVRVRTRAPVVAVPVAVSFEITALPVDWPARAVVATLPAVTPPEPGA